MARSSPNTVWEIKSSVRSRSRSVPDSSTAHLRTRRDRAFAFAGCLKDLKRFWRMDERDDDRTVARIFHDVGLLKNDLIPILLTTLGTSAKGDRIALACGEWSPCLLSSRSLKLTLLSIHTVELIGAMTWPINVAEELRDAQLLDELRKSIDYTSLISAQLSYKAIILRTGALRAMFQLMSPALTKTRR